MLLIYTKPSEIKNVHPERDKLDFNLDIRGRWMMFLPLVDLGGWI